MSSGLVSNKSKSKLRTTPAITRYSSARARLHGTERQLLVLVSVGHPILLLSSTPSSSLSKGHKATVLLPPHSLLRQTNVLGRTCAGLEKRAGPCAYNNEKHLSRSVSENRLSTYIFRKSSYSENVEHLTPAGITQCL